MSVVQNDGRLWLSTGLSRKETSWQNIEMKWSDLIDRCSVCAVTSETYTQYIAMPKDQQDEKKDVGGFVGGIINGGRRKKGSITSRYLITLDVDFATPGFWEGFRDIFCNAAFCYGTHKHSDQTPRYRLIMPLTREVFADEYQAISRKIAGLIGIELFDSTTFQPERLMYWPSVSKDREFYSELQDGPWLDPDAILRLYNDWKDVSQWPVSARNSAAIKRGIEKQGDPTAKPGVIGAFCRMHTITGAIETYLPDVYKATDAPDRFTFIHGSTAGGLVVYDDTFAYSHHGTDPASERLCNAFDLVRVHRFAGLDDNVNINTPINKYPSHLAMMDLALKDKAVVQDVSLAKLKEAGFDFGDIALETDQMDWIKNLDTDRSGTPKSTTANVILIMRHDPYLKDCFAYNDFGKRPVVLRDLPWRTVRGSGDQMVKGDDAGLRTYLEKNYKIAAATKVDDGLTQILLDNTFHPIKQYLRSLYWDGTRRLDTLLIDYMGVEDSLYTREVTRKAFVAAVARVMQPGVKFDNMLVLVGAQGLGKSTLIDKMGREWFSDGLGNIDRHNAAEQLQGVWLMEVAELAGFKKSDVEMIKHFIAKREDQFRAAYGHRMEIYPRQCVFFGTTNKTDFLNDPTGDRRFWPVACGVSKTTKSVFADLTAHEIGQLWAEAVERWDENESLQLSQEVEKLARMAQDVHTESDERERLIVEYIDTEVPSDWYQMTSAEHRLFFSTDEDMRQVGVMIRYKISALEIWLELFGGNQKDANYYNLKFIREIMDKQKGWDKGFVFIAGRSARGWTRRGWELQ